MQLAHQQSNWVAGMTAATEGTVSHAETSDTNDGFLGRPVKLATFAWQVGQPLFHQFNPWSMLCEDPRNINRLAHFKNMRMDLNVQAVINGNPFYYGRAVMSYVPLQAGDAYSRAEAGNIYDLVHASQRPHIYLDPCKSEGGELELPFLYPKTYMDIPSSEWTKMGMCVLQDINPLYHANEQGDSVDITIFVYAKNVSLNTPTCQIPSTLVPQGNDEYGKISYPAHLIANWAGRLANAPVIGAYARATEMIATAAGGVAAMFGYSRPNAVADEIMIARLFPSYATTNEKDDAVSLAVDAKREVTIDPRVVGLEPVDEMAIVPMAMRESYFNQFTWTTDNVPDEHLFSVRISPMLGLADNVNGEYAVTPAAYTALPFRYWKGSTVIRAQVVCSAYHRGRLRVVWDPDHCNANCAEMFNTNYSMLLDITESQDITFKIGWGANTDYLVVPELDHVGTSVSVNNFTTNIPTCNGTLSFYVVNGLTCPGAVSTPVNVNLFQSMADDFEVAVPDDVNGIATVTTVPTGPLGPPTDGPDAPPGPPPDTNTIVSVRDFAFGQIWQNSTPNRPYTTNFNNFTQSVWIEGNNTYFIHAWGGGTTNVTTANIVLEFNNHQSIASDISVTIGGVIASGTLPPNIGATLSLLVPDVPVVGGANQLVATIEASNRAICRFITTTLPETYQRTFVRGSTLLPLIDGTDAVVFNIGSYTAVKPITGNALTINAPSNVAPSTRGSVASRYGFDLNGVDNPQDGAASMTNQRSTATLPDVSEQWTVSQGASTNWECEITKFCYYIDTSLPAPQGDIQREDPEMEMSYQQFLTELALAEIEDAEENAENVAPQGNCLRGQQRQNLTTISEEHEQESFEAEVREVEFYISPSESESTTDNPNPDCPVATEESQLIPQGDDTPEERNDDKDDANAPEHEVVDLSMGPTSDVPGLSAIYFGEQVTSWRQMLKRYSQKFQIGPAGAANAFSTEIYSPPLVEGGNMTVGSGISYSINHLLDYLTPAYVCQRGGVKFRLSVGNTGDLTSVWVKRLTYLPGRILDVFTGSEPPISKSNFSGGHNFNFCANPSPAFEIPWYSRFRFVHGRNPSVEDTENYIERDFARIFLRARSEIGVLHVAVATAEDFSLSGFLSTPTLAYAVL